MIRRAAWIRLWLRKQRLRRRLGLSARRRALAISEPVYYSIHEYAEEARHDAPLLRMTGGEHSANGHRDVLERRYRRQLLVAGRGPTSWRMMAALAGAVSVMLAVGALYWQLGRVEDLATWGRILFSCVISLPFAALGYFAVHIISGRAMWSTAFTLVHIVEHGDSQRPYLPTAIGRLYRPKLAIADRHGGRMFGGGTRNSGIFDGTVTLQLLGDMKLEDVDSVNLTNILPRKTGLYSGLAERALDQRINRVAALARRRGDLQRDPKLTLIDRLAPWIITVICIVVSLMAVQS